jgi:tellurite resistance protein TerC
MSLKKDIKLRPEGNPILRLLRKFLPLSDNYHESKFLVKKHGWRLATPPLLVLVVVETTNVVFAVDSIL